MNYMIYYAEKDGIRIELVKNGNEYLVDGSEPGVLIPRKSFFREGYTRYTDAEKVFKALCYGFEINNVEVVDHKDFNSFYRTVAD